MYDQSAMQVSGKDGNRLEFSAPAVGFVDAQGAYSASPPGRTVYATLHLVKTGGNWRIDSLPAGLFVSRQDFDREFASVNVYFFNGYPRPSVLVPDPLFLPLRGDLPTALATALLRGPSRWLSPAVVTELPKGASLDGPVSLAAGVASVRLTPGSVPQGVARDNMLGQIVMTLTEDPDVRAVEVSSDGETLTMSGRKESRLTRADITLVLPADLRPSAVADGYYLRDGQAYIAGPPARRGPFGPSVKLAELAGAPGNALIAGISKDRKTLWTASRNAPTRTVVRLEGVALRSPSFDQEGNLWVVDGTGADVTLRRVPVTGPVLAVTLKGLVATQITKLRVAPDGTRVGLVLRTVEGAQVYLGLVTESAAGVSIAGVRRLGHRLRAPRDVAWAEPDRLVVLAAERNAQPQPYLVHIDGSFVDAVGPLADISSLTAAAGQPILAGTSKKGIYRLRAGTWTRVGTGGAPRYPG